MNIYKNTVLKFWHCIVPYGFNNDKEKVKEMRSWCRVNCEDTWAQQDLHNQSNFVFVSEKDVTIFALRWA
jgi:hypothetical protein